MSDSTDVVFLCILSFLTVLILIVNTYTVFVFWIHRKKLKRTFLLVINLAFADLFVGFTGILTVIGASALQRHTGLNNTSYNTFFGISVILHGTFPFISVYFLVLISLERAFALIWPLRHRVARIKVYIYSVVIVWIPILFIRYLKIIKKTFNQSKIGWNFKSIGKLFCLQRILNHGKGTLYMNSFSHSLGF